MKKFTALLLVFSIMMLSVNLNAKERRGAKLIITKLDGKQMEGELIAVKKNSLVLLNTDGKDVSVDIKEIKVIRVDKKPKVWSGVGNGSLLGLFSGLAIGIAVSAGREGYEKLAGGAVAVLMIVGGTLIGGVVGALAGIDEIIQIEGNPPSVIEFHLEKLRKKARIRDYE